MMFECSRWKIHVNSRWVFLSLSLSLSVCLSVCLSLPFSIVRDAFDEACSLVIFANDEFACDWNKRKNEKVAMPPIVFAFHFPSRTFLRSSVFPGYFWPCRTHHTTPAEPHDNTPTCTCSLVHSNAIKHINHILSECRSDPSIVVNSINHPTPWHDALVPQSELTHRHCYKSKKHLERAPSPSTKII